MDGIEDAHLDDDTLLRLLADANEDWLRFLLHELSRCEPCREVGGYLLELFRAGALKIPIGLGVLTLARSRMEAPRLWAELESLPLEQARSRIQTDRRFESWGLCELLCRESKRTAAADAVRALHLGELAVLVADLVEDDGPIEDRWVYQLRAYAWAHLGNARRVLGDLRGADEALSAADLWWQSGSVVGDTLGYGPVIQDLQASLRIAQRRFPEALELLDQVIDAYTNGDPEFRDRHLTGRAAVQKALAMGQMGAPESAIRALKEAKGLVDPERDPRLLLCLHHNLVSFLANTGRFAEAEQALPELESASRRIGNALDLVRLRWVEARIAVGLGQSDRAREAFEDVRLEFEERDMGYDAALVSLEIAAVSLEEGRTAEVKELARQVVAIFRAQGVPREVLAALMMFRRAALQERATAQMARELAEMLGQRRRG
jgi:tetratricopeptide (TPR) repeat protein